MAKKGNSMPQARRPSVKWLATFAREPVPQTHLATCRGENVERQKAVQIISKTQVGLTGRGSIPSSRGSLPAPVQVLQPRLAHRPHWVSPPSSPQFFLSCGFPCLCLSLSPSLLLQGVALKADPSFATARNRGRPPYLSSRSCSSITSPSSWPRPGPSTAFPSSTASRAAAAHSSLPHWLSLLLKAQPQLPQENHRHSHPRPLAEVPETLGLSQRPQGHHPWEATPQSGVPAPLGLAPIHLPLPPVPRLQSRPQHQKVYGHGATPVLLLCGLPPPSSHGRRTRRFRPWLSTGFMAQEACRLWAPGDLALPGQRVWLEEVARAAWHPDPTMVRASSVAQAILHLLWVVSSAFRRRHAPTASA